MQVLELKKTVLASSTFTATRRNFSCCHCGTVTTFPTYSPPSCFDVILKSSASDPLRSTPKLQKSFREARKILVTFSCHTGQDEQNQQLSICNLGLILPQCIRQFMDSEVQSFKKSTALQARLNFLVNASPTHIIPILKSAFQHHITKHKAKNCTNCM